MLGSLYFSEIAGYIPCKLCWYQRILMYPLTIILLVVILRRIGREAPHIVLPFTVIGSIVSTYHYLLQKTDLFSSATVCSENAPCSTTWINWFGFVTIPFLALTAFLIITVAMLVVLTGAPETEAEWEDEQDAELLVDAA